jgi:hypothetical protein
VCQLADVGRGLLDGDQHFHLVDAGELLEEVGGRQGQVVDAAWVLQEASDPGERLHMVVEVDAAVGGADAAFRRNRRRFDNTSPAPPTAREPRCTKCKSFGNPLSDEYWHMGETAMRVRRTTSFNRNS